MFGISLNIFFLNKVWTLSPDCSAAIDGANRTLIAGLALRTFLLFIVLARFVYVNSLGINMGIG